MKFFMLAKNFGLGFAIKYSWLTLLYKITKNKKHVQKKHNLINNYLTKRGARRYTAEIVYKYLFDNNFIEEHTGLADCLIEAKIMCELVKRKPEINFSLWN